MICIFNRVAQYSRFVVGKDFLIVNKQLVDYRCRSCLLYTSHKNFSLHTFTQPEIADNAKYHQHERQSKQWKCPPSTVPNRQDANMKYSRFFIPFTVIVRCFYIKSIVTCRQIRVRNRTGIVLSVPLVIIPFQFISKSVVFASDIVGHYKRYGEWILRRG